MKLKNLTPDQLETAPIPVYAVYVSVIIGEPFDDTYVSDIIKSYPTWFPKSTVKWAGNPSKIKRLNKIKCLINKILIFFGLGKHRLETNGVIIGK